MDTFDDDALPLWLKEIVANGEVFPQFSLFDEKVRFCVLNKHSEGLERYLSPSECKTLKKNRKRVAFFRDGPFLSEEITTGAIVSLLGEMNALADRGYDVYLIYCFRGWSDPALYKYAKFTTIFIRPEDFYSSGSFIEALISTFGISICQFDSAEAVCLQSDLVRSKAKVVFEVHNVEYDLLGQLHADVAEVAYIKDKERMALHMSDLVLVRSHQDTMLLEKITETKCNVRPFRGCINTDQIYLIERLYTRRTVLFLGHLNYAPNIQAVDLIFTKIAPDVDARFIIVGAGSEKLITKYTNTNVAFLGYVHNLNVVFSEADIGIAPIAAGSGTRLKILDYMASGMPVIGTNLAIEGLEKQINGAMIVEDDIEKYPEILNQLFENPFMRMSYSKKGYEYVTTYRNWRNCIGDIIEGYHSLFLKPCNKED